MEVLLDTVFWLSTAVIALLTLCGVGLLLAPDTMRRLSNHLDRWYSLRNRVGFLEHPYYPEHGLYHHHRLIGLLLVVGAGYTLLRIPVAQSADIAPVLPQAWPQFIRALIAESALPFLLLSNLCALCLGIIIYLRPSLLRQVEHSANRWLSTRRALKPLDIPRNELDRFLWRYPRLVGLFLLLGSLYMTAVVTLFPALFSH